MFKCFATLPDGTNSCLFYNIHHRALHTLDREHYKFTHLIFSLICSTFQFLLAVLNVESCSLVKTKRTQLLKKKLIC